MKKAIYERYGNPTDVVKLVDIDYESLGPDDVRIDLEISSINPADLLSIQGLYPIKPKLPTTPGNEGVAFVKELGNNVTNINLGDRVFIPFKPGIGAWGEEIIVPGKTLFALPKEADPAQLAMASVNPPSAYYMLTKFVNLSKGDWIIQNSANSAVGRYVITFAKNMGIKTVNVVRRKDIIDDLYEEGGDIVLVDGPDLAKRVKKLVTNKSIKLGFDGVAGDATHRISQCLAFGSTLVNYGAMSLKRCELGATQTIFKQIKLVGLWLQKWTEIADSGEVKDLYELTNEAVINGTVKAKVEKIYSLFDIKEALTHSMRDKRSGKILISGPRFK
ncbi:MAG: zinc-dependent alcohol dehydrogenase family protein [Candidatus Heimdallarchaeota archaeon]